MLHLIGIVRASAVVTIDSSGAFLVLLLRNCDTVLPSKLPINSIQDDQFGNIFSSKKFTEFSRSLSSPNRYKRVKNNPTDAYNCDLYVIALVIFFNWQGRTESLTICRFNYSLFTNHSTDGTQQLTLFNQR